jgi:protein-disulfide isomerase
MNQGRNLIIGVVTATLILLLGGVWLISGRQKPPEKVNLAAEGSQTRGADNGNVTLVEFGDFQCPSCKTIDLVLKQLIKEFPDNLTLVWRNFPLTGHKNARAAASAAEAAGKQGKYWEMHDKLFETQTGWSGADNAGELFAGYAQSLELDKQKFLDDTNSADITEIIRRDMQMGYDLGITGTPTFFINGEEMAIPGSLDDFRAIIKAAVAKAPAVKGAEKYSGQAKIKVILLGNEVDLAQDKYQSSASAQLNSDIQFRNGDGQTLHLYKRGVTLDEFFKSLKISFSDRCFELDTGRKYCNSDQTTLKMYVNGQVSGQYQNYAPADADKILITYGKETVAEVQKQIDSITD